MKLTDRILATLCACFLLFYSTTVFSSELIEIKEKIGLWSAGVPGLKSERIFSVLSSVSDEAYNTRGQTAINIYSLKSPSVSLIFTDDSVGSGSLIDNKGHILTNWHVVQGYKNVGVIFKPKKEGESPSISDALIAEVIKIDEVTDLALIKLKEPPKNISPIDLASESSVKVGQDVHAIGHPTGESWTYTRGYVSQIRHNYEWVTQKGVKHIADVIQTQTPINPGNSGGPLLDSEGKLLGINSFKVSGEGLNFAVSVGVVKSFLNSKSNRYAEKVQNEECEVETLKEYYDDDEKSTVTVLDIDCNGSADSLLYVPDDANEPLTLRIDTTGDGKLDTVIFDSDRDGNPDLAGYDTTGDGEFDLVGYFREGESEPYRVEKVSS